MTKCRHADQYKAIHPPRCNVNGKPCDVCYAKWEAKLEAVSSACNGSTCTPVTALGSIMRKLDNMEAKLNESPKAA